jgi:hypothetical protein
MSIRQDNEIEYIACMKCGTREHIDLIDAKAPPGNPDPDNAEWAHFECIACYGPGWDSTLRADEMQAKSVAPHLKPLYLKYYAETA